MHGSPEALLQVQHPVASNCPPIALQRSFDAQAGNLVRDRH